MLFHYVFFTHHFLNNLVSVILNLLNLRESRSLVIITHKKMHVSDLKSNIFLDRVLGSNFMSLLWVKIFAYSIYQYSALTHESLLSLDT